MKKNKAIIFLSENFVLMLSGLFIIAAFIFYMFVGEDSYIAVHDNLDLFIPQFRMMKNTGTFFSHGEIVPFLGGISRDTLPSELSLSSLIYFVLPEFYAYIVCYILKIIIAMASFALLAFELLDNKFEFKTRTLIRNVVFGCGFIYGILNLFPMFGIPFASIPLIVFLLVKIYRKPSLKLYIAVFAYPFISYFSYFGFFILCYLAVAIIWLWIRDAVCSRKKSSGSKISNRKLHISWSLVLAAIVLAAGYVIFEYRLFGTMLFGSAETIRTTMVEADLGLKEILAEAADVFINGMMHADDAHRFVIMPLCVIYFFFLNIRYVVKRNFKGIFTDLYNLCMLLLVFNSLMYGLYDSAAVRGIVEAVLPPLKGFQFNRTIFFSPFIWCVALCIICVRIVIGASSKSASTLEQKGEFCNSTKICVRGLYIFSYLIVFISAAVVLIYPSGYNDLYHTAYGTFYRCMHNGQGVDSMDYREFYSEDLFSFIKADIGYESDEWAVAYGMYPAVLEYNGISTLDGYLGFYTQDYKDRFRKVISPALERVPASKAYFDNWGARCCLYFGTDASVQLGTKSLTGLTDTDIYIDADALEELGCRYVFSRIEIGNADEMGLLPVKSYVDVVSNQTYPVYVYSLKA